MNEAVIASWKRMVEQGVVWNDIGDRGAYALSAHCVELHLRSHNILLACLM